MEIIGLFLTALIGSLSHALSIPGIQLTGLFGVFLFGYTWVTKVDNVDYVAAAHINTLQAEKLDRDGGVPLTAGLKFPATAVPSADVNTLDDYEEGTWTPVYSGSTGSIGATAYSTQVGTYTKIGRIVHIKGSIILTNNGDWTGSVRITGLPFAAAGGVATGPLMTGNITYDGQLFVYTDNTFTLLMIGVSKTATALDNLACSGVPNTGVFYFELTYNI